MAKKNVSTPPSNPGLSIEASEFLEFFYSRPPEEQDAFIAEQTRLRRKLILLDFKPYGILEELERLREMVEAGEINGLLFAAKYTKPGKHRHFFGASGRYSENIDEAIGAAVLLQNKLAQA
jgi:hypothetical protein